MEKRWIKIELRFHWLDALRLLIGKPCYLTTELEEINGVVVASTQVAFERVARVPHMGVDEAGE